MNMRTRALAISLALCLALGLTWKPRAFAVKAAPDLETMAGQMVMAGFRGTDMPESAPMVRDISAGLLGGVILFDYDVALRKKGRNIVSPGQVAGLTARLKAMSPVPLLVAVDQEGGKVARLKPEYGFPPMASAADIGASGDAEAAFKAGKLAGRTLAGSGFNVDFAPVVDVNVNPDSPAIGKLGRSFSSSPETVADMAGAFIRGLETEKVLSCVKHFPGHGSATADSHLGLTDVTGTWSPLELMPYEALIKDGLAPMIMTAHVFNSRLDPEYPATLSKKTITGVLRDQLGYDGVVVSDDMQMKAIAARYDFSQSVFLAIDAGVDILLFGNNLSYDPMAASRARAAIVELVTSGRIDRKRIERSYRRIQTLKTLRLLRE